jgi:hypothetical protein
MPVIGFISYRREWDHERGGWKDRPRHDDASHGADALLTFACSGFTPPAARSRFHRSGSAVFPMLSRARAWPRSPAGHLPSEAPPGVTTLLEKAAEPKHWSRNGDKASPQHRASFLRKPYSHVPLSCSQRADRKPRVRSSW